MKTILFVYSSTRDIYLSPDVQLNITQIFDDELYLKIVRNMFSEAHLVCAITPINLL